MIGLLFSILKGILTVLLKTAALKFLRPHLLKLDKWCEEKIGIDIIKQEKKWFEKHPLLLKRIEKLEKKSHTPKGLSNMDGYSKLIERLNEIEQETLTLAGHIEKLEKK
tara:strand:- start:2339 stop:2665 length:327 start_codon:yes stop_codon:yes gene_type:complete